MSPMLRSMVPNVVKKIQHLRLNHRAVFRGFAVLIQSLLLKYQPSKWKNPLLRCANNWGLLHTANPAYSACKSVFANDPSTSELESFLNSVHTSIPASFTGSNFSPCPLPVSFPPAPTDFVWGFPIEVWRCIAFFLPTPYLISRCCTSYALMCTLWNAGKYDKVWIEHFEPVLYFAPKIFNKLNFNFHTLSRQLGSSSCHCDAMEV